jgi:hypothetical protein
MNSGSSRTGGSGAQAKSPCRLRDLLTQDLTRYLFQPMFGFVQPIEQPRAGDLRHLQSAGSSGHTLQRKVQDRVG